MMIPPLILRRRCCCARTTPRWQPKPRERQEMEQIALAEAHYQATRCQEAINRKLDDLGRELTAEDMPLAAAAVVEPKWAPGMDLEHLPEIARYYACVAICPGSGSRRGAPGLLGASDGGLVARGCPGEGSRSGDGPTVGRGHRWGYLI